jgi:hypothetical protein
MTDQNQTPLINLLKVLDRLPVRYLHDRVTFQHRDAAVTPFPGTKLPMKVKGKFEDGTLVYSDRWICCGEYGCSSGDPSKKKKTRSHHCAARMTVQVTVAAGKSLISISEDGEHGDGFATPDAPPHGRNDWRSKMIVAVAVDGGVTTLRELLSDQWWPLALAPRPSTENEKKSMRRRLANQVKKRAPSPALVEEAALDENKEN